jgi:ferredoxin--NADP+ reductase
VAWYNGHPDYQDLPFDLDVQRAVVIGNGNVALDVARMLVLTTEELAPTDTTDAAIEAITSAGIEEVVILGRRGPAEAAFTPPELAELADLAGAGVIVDPAELELDTVSGARRTPTLGCAEPGDPERLRLAEAGREAEDASPALPHVAGRDPRRPACRGR